MRKSFKILIASIAIIVVSLSSFYLIKGSYPYDLEDYSDIYYTTIMIVKGIHVVGAMISITLFITSFYKK